MPRIRSIKPEFFLHEGLAELQALTRLLFIGLWTQADGEGRLADRPMRLKASLLPYDDADVDKMLESLASHKERFIVRYVSNGTPAICIPSFKDHQRITGKEAETVSEYAPPATSNSGEATGNQRGNIGETPDVQERKGKEGKGGERKGVGAAQPALPGLAAESGQPSPSPAQQGSSEAQEAPAASPPVSEFVQYVMKRWPDVREPAVRELEWREACPAVDLLAEARKAWAWENETAKHKKTQHTPFLGRWFRREQDNASRSGGGPVRPATGRRQNEPVGPDSHEDHIADAQRRGERA